MHSDFSEFMKSLSEVVISRIYWKFYEFHKIRGFTVLL